jgi:DNA polymerase IV
LFVGATNRAGRKAIIRAFAVQLKLEHLGHGIAGRTAQPQREYSLAMVNRAILHVDMDAFYASVEQRDQPELRDRPVLVGGLGGRGVVAAASYEARRFGVRSAMPVREAIRLCPDAVCIEPRTGHYRKVSRQIFAIFEQFTPLVEGLSLDEAFLDISDSRAKLLDASKIAVAVKQQIRSQTGLTASVGVAPNKLVAKIASDLEKPDGLVVVGEGDVQALLDPLPVRKLFGLGAKTSARVEAIGIRTLGQLRRAPAAQLRPIFGRYAERIRQRAAGQDDRDVITHTDEKQISAEETFDVDITDQTALHRILLRLADRVCGRLRQRELLAGCVTVKIRRSDFTTVTRQRRIEPPSHETRLITDLARLLLRDWLASQPRVALRLLGIGASELSGIRQPDLFATEGPVRTSRLDETVDEIREKYGIAALTRGSALPRVSNPGAKKGTGLLD